MCLCCFLTHQLCVALPAKPSALRTQFPRSNAAILRLPLPSTSRVPNNMQGGEKVSFLLFNRLATCAYHIKLDVLLLVRGMPWIGKSAVGGPLSFSGAFPNLGKWILDFKCLSLRPSVRPSVHMEELGSQFWIFLKYYILSCFRKCIDKIQVSLKSNKNGGTAQEGLCTFSIIYSWILRLRNVSDKLFSKNHNTHFIFSNLFPKIVLFVR
jgi:hypothetical protein